MEIREQLKQLIIEYYQSVVPDYQIDESKLKYDVLDDREILQYDGLVADHVKGENEINLFDLQSEWPCAVKKKKLAQSDSWNPEIEPENNPIDEELKEQLEIAEGYGDYLIAQKKAGVFNKPTKTNENQRKVTKTNENQL